LGLRTQATIIAALLMIGSAIGATTKPLKRLKGDIGRFL
jgi:hypothetical protein